MSATSPAGKGWYHWLGGWQQRSQRRQKRARFDGEERHGHLGVGVWWPRVALGERCLILYPRTRWGTVAGFRGKGAWGCKDGVDHTRLGKLLSRHTLLGVNHLSPRPHPPLPCALSPLPCVFAQSQRRIEVLAAHLVPELAEVSASPVGATGVAGGLLELLTLDPEGVEAVGEEGGAASTGMGAASMGAVRPHASECLA